MKATAGWRGIAVAVAVLSVGRVAAAEPGADDLVKYRKAVMKSQREHLAAATAIVQNKVQYPKHLADHVQSLAATTAVTVELFPKGSDGGDTGALGAVWSDAAEFQKRADDNQRKAAALAKAVAAGDTDSYAARLKDLQESCKACHKDFRREVK